MRAAIFLFPLILAACVGNSMMTINAFYEIPIGSSTNEVVQSAGEPYAIHKKLDGTVEYEYIERIKAGGRNLEERHYFILIKDGKVVAKRIEESSPAPFIFDSYDMQTTQTSSERKN